MRIVIWHWALSSSHRIWQCKLLYYCFIFLFSLLFPMALWMAQVYQNWICATTQRIHLILLNLWHWWSDVGLALQAALRKWIRSFGYLFQECMTIPRISIECHLASRLDFYFQCRLRFFVSTVFAHFLRTSLTLQLCYPGQLCHLQVLLSIALFSMSFQALPFLLFHLF